VNIEPNVFNCVIMIKIRSAKMVHANVVG